mgnify:FL=1
MPMIQKNYPVFTSSEKESWNSKMGRHYLQAGNLWQSSDRPITFDLKIGEIGQSRVVDLDVGPCEVYTNPDYKNKSNRPGILEEFYVASGSMKIEFENKSFDLKEGNILIFDDSNPPVKFIIQKQTHIINIFMPQIVLKSWMPRTYDKLHHTLLAPDQASSKLLGEYLEMLAAYSIDKNKKPLTKSTVPLAMANISMLVFALSELDEQQPESIKEAQLDLAKQYMLVHISNSKVSPSLIANELNISVRYLHWLFKQTDETVIQFLTRKRIELAQLLLVSSSKSTFNVTEIAFMCGFNDSTHFSRRFKKQVGISPSTFRKNNFKP